MGGGLGWVQRDKRRAEDNGLDRQRWFDQVETVNAGRHQTAWAESHHDPRHILLATLAPAYLYWGGASCVG